MPHFLGRTNARDVPLRALDEEAKAVPAPGVPRGEFERVEPTVQRPKLTAHHAFAEERRTVSQKAAKLRDRYLMELAKAPTYAAA